MKVVRSPRVALGVTALAGLTVLGGVGVAMSNDGTAVNGASHMNITGVATTSTKSSSSSSSSSSPSDDPSSSATQPPGSGGDATDLYAALPPGFNNSNCKPSGSPVSGATATLDCAAALNGPTAGRFALFPTQASLDKAFQNWMADDELSPCPGMQHAPSDWSYDPNSAPDGKVACGTFEGDPDLIWTENSTKLLGNISGGTIDSLYNYWSGGGSGTSNAIRNGIRGG